MIQGLCLCEQRQTLCEILCNYLRRKLLHVEITFELFVGKKCGLCSNFVHKGKDLKCGSNIRLASIGLCRCGYSEGSRLGCQIYFYAKGQFGQKKNFELSF